MAKSHYEQDLLPSRDFVESAGAILFDFRHTGITLDQLLQPTTQEEAGITYEPKTNSEPTVAFIHSHGRKSILLPKGRRNINESRSDAALRETYEETGLRCRLLPITLHTRATSVDPSHDRANDEGYTLNEVRHFKRTTDPFYLMVRHATDRQQAQHNKLIWWYIAVVDNDQDKVPIQLDPGCELKAVPITQAEETLTFAGDRTVLKEAIQVVQETLGIRWVGWPDDVSTTG